MRGSPKSGPPNTFKGRFFLAAFHAHFCWFPAIAQETRGNDASGPGTTPAQRRS